MVCALNARVTLSYLALVDQSWQELITFCQNQPSIHIMCLFLNIPGLTCCMCCKHSGCIWHYIYWYYPFYAILRWGGSIVHVMILFIIWDVTIRKIVNLDVFYRWVLFSVFKRTKNILQRIFQMNTHLSYCVETNIVIVCKLVVLHIPMSVFDPYHWCVNINIINCEKNWPSMCKKWHRVFFCLAIVLGSRCLILHCGCCSLIPTVCSVF